MRGNLAELAATGLASEPTLRKWIAAKPDRAWIIKRGKNGDGYEIDFEGAAAEWRAEQDAATEAARQRADMVRQFGLELGLSAAAEPVVGISIVERRQLLEEEIVANKVARDRRELVAVDEVVGAVGDVLVRYAQQFDTFTARLAKRIDLSREQLAQIDRLLIEDRTAVARQLAEWSSDGDESGDSGPGAAMEAAAQADA